MTLHFFLIISDAKNIYYLLFKLETSCAFIGHTKKDWTEKENLCLPVVVHWSEAWQDVSKTAVPVQLRLTLSPLY